MNFENLTPGQVEAISISLDKPSDRTLAEFLEETATDLTLTETKGGWIEVRTDDQGGEMTGQLVDRSDSQSLDCWDMIWDGWEF